MSIIQASRVLARSILHQSSINPLSAYSSLLLTAVRKKATAPFDPGCFKFQSIDQLPYETHDDKNKRLGRPLSPHLSVYRPQYTSVLSILHRITGAAFASLVFTFALCSLVLPESIAYYICRCNVALCEMEIPGILVTLFKMSLAFPLVYHTMNGMRHLFADVAPAFALNLNMLFISGIVMFAAVTLIMCGVGFAALPEAKEVPEEEPKK